jgi:hypothetical protein
MANLGRLAEDGLLAVTSDGVTGDPRSYLLPPAGGDGDETSSA